MTGMTCAGKTRPLGDDAEAEAWQRARLDLPLAALQEVRRVRAVRVERRLRQLLVRIGHVKKGG